MINKITKVIREMVEQEIAEMARISTTIAIDNKEKLAKAKTLFGDSWIGKMVKAVEEAGETGITRDALIDAVDKNQLTLNPKIKDFIEIGLFKEAGLEREKKEKGPGVGTGKKGRPASEKGLVAKEVNSKLEADNNYQPTPEELELLGAEFIEKLRARVKGELKRGRKADPTKTDSLSSRVRNIMNMDDDALAGLVDDEDEFDELDEQFMKMRKLAGINENKDKLYQKYRGEILDQKLSYKSLESALEKDPEYKTLSYQEKQSLLKKLTHVIHSEYN